MSKNITIQEGGASRSFTAEKLRTNLQGGGTCDWVPIDEVNSYVELEDLYVTENGIYYPTEKVGLSKVTVDVQGSGGGGVVPSGTTVRAVAAENLTAGDCVYIISGGSGGIAPLVDASINGISGNLSLAYGNGYIYFINDYGSRHVYRLAIGNLTANPEIYVNIDSGGSNRYLSRCLIAYSGTGDSLDHLENVETGFRYDGNEGVTAEGIQFGYTGFSQNYVYTLYSGYRRITDLVHIQKSITGDWPYVKYFTDTKSVILVNSTKYRIYVSGTQTNEVNLDTSVDNSSFNVINKYLVAWTSSSPYSLVYFDLDANDGVAHNVKDKNNNNIVTTRIMPLKFNANGTVLCAQLGSNGLGVIYSDLSAVIYTNITGLHNNSEMLGDYYWDAEHKQLYYVPQNNVMGKTNDKNHAGSLGFVQVDIPAGVEGNAIEMFR